MHGKEDGGTGFHGKGKWFNSFETDAFAPLQQSIQTQTRGQYASTHQHSLMAASWNGWYGGDSFGSLNLASLTTEDTTEIKWQLCESVTKTNNLFSALAVVEESDDVQKPVMR